MNFPHSTHIDHQFRQTPPLNMPSRLAAPVLTVDAAKMHQVDPRNVESLFGMWMVFSKCAESIEEGKRLENLSWRLWNRETFCCEPQPHLATTPAIDVPLRRPSQKEVPELSVSVESITSDTAERRPACSIPRTPQQSLIAEEDSALSRSRGKEQHMTAYGLEKMVISIKEKTDIKPLPLSIVASMPPISDTTPRPSSPSPERTEHISASQSQLRTSSDSCYSSATADSATSHQPSDHRGSDTSVSSAGLIQSGSIVHGFSPSKLPASFKLPAARPPMSSSPMRSAMKSKPEWAKKSGMFTLGGSSGEDESSFEDRMASQLKRPSSLAGVGRLLPKKGLAQTDVRIEEADTDEEEAVESGDDDDDDEEEDEASQPSDPSEVSESAIDESDWEDSDDHDESSVDDKALFQRVDSQANLVSRRSMLTMQLHEPDQKPGLGPMASKSTPALRRSRRSSPNGPSLPASPDDGEAVLTMRAPESTRPKPITTTTMTTTMKMQSFAHSPRTTRRNMLATELPESLRKHLLWERQQKNTTAHAVFKRRHTAQNLAVLQEHPGSRTGQPGPDTLRNNSWNHYFDTAWEYHAKGW